MRKVSFIDSTGLHSLEIFIESALKSGQQVILSGVNKRVYKALESAGIIRVLGDENVLDHIDLALARAEQLSKELEK
jgi:SulP family sulfate permease